MLNKREFYSKPVVIVLFALTACFLWGSAFPCVKIGYALFSVGTDVPSVLLYAGLRFTLAGMLTILIGSIGKRKLLVPKRENLWKVLLLSFFQTIGQYTFYYIGLYHTAGVKASVINGTGVFVSILLACFLFRQEKFNAVKLIGCLLGLSGVVLVNLGGSFDFNFAWNGELFLLIATLMSAFASNFSKIFSKSESPVTLSGWQFFLGGILLILTGLLTGGRVAPVNGYAYLMLLYLAIISSVAFSLMGLLLKYNPVSKIQSFNSLTPVFGFFLSAIILQEGNLLNVRAIVALCLVALGIWIINVYGEKTASKTEKKPKEI
ncbi:MAG: DMT family transporter [Christensenellaceae bacterium]